MKYLNLTIVFEGENLNYGESFGNVLSLKKIASRGKNYSYISRQAIRYDVIRILNESYGVPLTTVDKKSGVIQYTEDSKIDKFPEIDLFGYMKTGENKIRKAVVRLTDAISLEPFNNDLDFSTNKGLADRIKDNNDIFQSEFHKSFYSYTITVDLDKIGEDDNYDIHLSTDEKSKRIVYFLNAVKLLYRDIRGKRENLSPVFVIGGVYEVGNPFFYNKIELEFSKDKKLIKIKQINDVLNIKTLTKTVKQQTFLGCIGDLFNNVEEIQVNTKYDIETFFQKIEEEVKNYYKD